MCKALKDRFMIQEEEGAAVVEVTVITPMIFVILLGSILYLFFLFDMGVVKSETMRTANEISAEWRNENHKSISEKKSILKSRLCKRLVLTKIKGSSIHVTGENVIVKVKVIFSLAGKGLSFTSTGKVPVSNRERWVRIMCH